MKKNVIGSIFLALFLIFVIILFYQIILKLTGHSPIDAQIIYIGLGAIMSYILFMTYQLGIFVGDVKRFMKITNNSFLKFSGEIKDLKEYAKETNDELKQFIKTTEINFVKLGVK